MKTQHLVVSAEKFGIGLFTISYKNAIKGQQRSNIVNYALWLPNVVRIIPDASYEG